MKFHRLFGPPRGRYGDANVSVISGLCCSYKWKIPFVYKVQGESEPRTQWMDMTSGLSVSLLVFCAVLLVLLYRHVRKTRNFFSKYADHVIAKYAAKICGNRPRLHIRVNLTVHYWRGWDSTVVIY